MVQWFGRVHICRDARCRSILSESGRYGARGATLRFHNRANNSSNLSLTRLLNPEPPALSGSALSERGFCMPRHSPHHPAVHLRYGTGTNYVDVPQWWFSYARTDESILTLNSLSRIKSRLGQVEELVCSRMEYSRLYVIPLHLVLSAKSVYNF